MRRTDRGAAAVELALVLPVLLGIICGIIDFGRAYNAQITLATAAREGVRVWALGGAASDVQTRAQAAVGLLPDGTPVMSVTAKPLPTPPSTTTPTACTFGELTTVRVTTSFGYITPMIQTLAPGLTSLSSEGVMRCGG